MELNCRDDTKKIIQVRDMELNLINYEILEDRPFSSDTKRMNIIVKNSITKEIKFFMKGAEVVMRLKVKPAQRADLD
jgi:magnesium-transporting ATPase (P-type)